LLGQGEFNRDKPLTKEAMVRSRYASYTESWGRYAGYTYGYNRALFAQRVHDLLSLVAFANDGRPAGRVDIVGMAGAGHWAAAARAIAGNAIDRAAIDTAGFRFANLTTIDDPDFLPGGAKYDDLPGMMALSAPGHLWLAGEGDLSSSVITKAYDAAGHADHLTISQEEGEKAESAAVAWLSKDIP
jgi:hypothetical protein